jgi:hypothetical protein
VDQASSLTQANGAGADSTSLVVDDALYFQDGTWGSDLARAGFHADWIAIGTVDNTAEISSIDYDANTITLASPRSWADDAPVWLYRRSDGSVVLTGAAPDYGAYELGGEAGSGGAAGAGGGSAGGAGPGGAGANGGAGQGATAGADAAAEEDSGCGCRFRPAGTSSASYAAALAALSMLRRRRRA